MEQVILELPNNVAKKIKNLSSQEMKKFISVVTAFIENKEKSVRKNEKTIDVKAVKDLFKIMDKISIEAEKNGMTEEILNEILNEH